MYKPSSITDFFKPFAQSPQNEGPLPNDDSQGSRAVRQPHGSTSLSSKDKTKQVERKTTVPERRKRARCPSIQEHGLSLQDTQSNGVTDKIVKTETPLSISSSDSLSSQGAVSTSSQRVVKTGKVILRNSEDEASDSDSSLADIDDLLASKRATEKSSPPTEPELSLPHGDKRAGHEVCRKRRKARGIVVADNPQTTPPLPVIPKYKFSLESLVKQSKNYEESETQTAKARVLLQTIEHGKGNSSQRKTTTPDKRPKVDEELVASVMQQHGEGEDIGRLMTAIERTEALYQGKSWSFFEGTEELPKPKEDDFPQINQFNGILDDAHSRQQAFLSGYVGEMVEKGGLPEEVLVWILDEVCLETRDDLNHSYIHTIKNAGNQITPLLTPERLDTLFRNVGASDEALDKHRPIIPKPAISHQHEKNHRPRLLSVIHLLRNLAIFLDTASRIHAVELLCRLSVDDSLTTEGQITVAIADTFTRLTESIPEEKFDQETQVVFENIYTCIGDSNFRLQLLHNIPASSSRLSILRRRLSLAFFFQDPSYLSKNPQTLLNLEQIARHLQNPHFAIRQTTDYAELAASISILSIGVDAADPRSSDSDAPQYAAFNAEVDMLSDRVKAMFTQIVDSGASHMRRTEAKEILEGFHSRLIYAIRMKRKPKTLLVGNSDFTGGPDSRQGAIMRGFIQRAKLNDGLAMPDQGTTDTTKC